MRGIRAAFLDRDGVVIETEVRDGKPYAVHDLEQMALLAGVPEALGRLREAGYALFLVTNQPDIGNGLVEAARVAAMNAHLQRHLGLDGVYCCPHSQSANCDCRKPKPGLLLQAAEEHGVDLAASIMVGDRASDIEAGKAAGCRTVFIERGYREAGPREANMISYSLPGAVTQLLGPG